MQPRYPEIIQPCSIVDKGIFKEGGEHKEHTNSRPNVHGLNLKGLSIKNQCFPNTMHEWNLFEIIEFII